uniref:Uncharacterized protein n=1 Tax=Siphoviridae sp. ctNwR4 TaxID=2825474 RepID=A0A8S5P1Z6_9CAUD|nr:MAG TPA: hypothetical protein [Siphoviridae sp. ctNwR4]
MGCPRLFERGIIASRGSSIRLGIVGRGIILALPHIKNMETTRKQGHNLPSKRLIDRPKERKTPYVNRVGINNQCFLNPEKRW